MTYVVPDSTIQLFTGIPIDMDYSRTLYFASATAQDSYFSSAVAYTFPDNSYQRVSRNRIRLGVPVGSVYNINYLRFKNSAHSQKWYYAFVTNVEYVNEKTSEIEYVIDDIQTWFIQAGTLGECFVEREHSATDNIGDNLVPEKLDLGEYVTDDFSGSGHASNLCIIVAATFDLEYAPATGDIHGGIYSGLRYHWFPYSVEGAAACSAFIEGAAEAGVADGIVSVFTMFNDFYTYGSTTARSYSVTKTKNLSRLGSYTNVKNKKLFTYPYNFLYVSNLNGDSVEYPYENFSTSDCNFVMIGTTECSPEVTLVPSNYLGALANYDKRISFTEFPQLAYNTNAFANWLALNRTTLKTGAAVNAIKGAMYLGLGNVYGAAITGSALVNTQAALIDKSKIPNEAHTGTGTNALLGAHALDFAFMHKHIKPQVAQIIDDYFNMYGYATHRVKTPNLVARPHWNYVKTTDCIVNGNMPADAEKHICQIFNNGITFWKHASEVGNYSLDNSP